MAPKCLAMIADCLIQFAPPPKCVTGLRWATFVSKATIASALFLMLVNAFAYHAVTSSARSLVAFAAAASIQLFAMVALVVVGSAANFVRLLCWSVEKELDNALAKNDDLTEMLERVRARFVEDELHRVQDEVAPGTPSR
jgi:membrane protein YdbS with pleckstrin-like domain